MLARIFPASLFGRLVTAMLGAVIASTLAVGLLVARELRDLSFWRSEAVDVVGTITKLSSELAAMPSEARSEALAALREQRVMAIGRQPPRGRPFPKDTGLVARAYEERLRKESDGLYKVTVRPAGPERRGVVFLGDEAAGEPKGLGLADSDAPAGGDRPLRVLIPGAGPGPGGRPFGWILDTAVDLPGGDTITFRSFAPPPVAPAPWHIFLRLGVLTLVLGIALYIVARTITRPLSELASAADAVGRGARVAPLRERGSRELREATRAFNAMQERLHRYLDSRTRVLAAMSHDLRTPLTRLRLRAESIEDPRQQERINADLEEMDQMVRNALDLFRGLNQDEETRLLDMDALLEELRAEFAELGATVGVAGQARRPIRLRPLAIKRCLSNLVTNALKFGGSAEIVVEDGVSLVISVRDQGPGIPDAALEQVFEPFFRLESSRNIDTGGAGLGLSIARDLAQLHGGSLKLRNLRPSGLEASLELPRDTREDP